MNSVELMVAPQSARDPNQWKRVRVGDTLRLINGVAFKPSDWSEHGLPIVRIQNLNNPQAPFNRFAGERPQKFRLRGGELLFAWSGTPGTSFGAHIWRGGDAWLNQHIFNVLFDEDEWDKRFLRLAINQNLADYVRAAHGGAGLAHITKGRFEDSELPQPPLAEQQRIVAEIEKQLTRLEAGVAALRRAQANLKRYRAAVLTAACEGRLVPTEAELARREGREYESGEALLSRVLALRFDEFQRQVPAHRRGYKPPPPIDGSDRVHTPEGWTWATLEQLTSAFRVICYGILMPKEHVPDGVLYVKVKDLKGDRVDIDGLQRTAPAIAAKYHRASLRSGDLLLAIRGTYGRVAITPAELDGGNITQDTARLDVSPLLDVRYVATCLRSEPVQRFFKAVARGVAVKGVNIGDVRMTPIPVPPLAEQHRIVAEVERRLSVVEELEAAVAANLARAGRLRQAILQRAFRGELVPPEPAE
ncbi:restriction endonuclease subunit S [bacterium]|nr:restriction endonuclease subunit S [bacterium]